MKALIQDIVHLWQREWSFRLAAIFLAVLCLLSIILPLLPLPYTPNDLDLQNVFLPPFKNGAHWLGTDQLGRDVLTNLLYGVRNGLTLALPVMLISSVAGTGIGALAGYFGNNSLSLKRGSLLILVCCCLLLLYYFMYVPLQVVKQALPASITFTSVGTGLAIIAILYWGVHPLLSRWHYFKKQITVPLDGITLRTIELITSLPKLLIVITVAAFAPPSVLLLSCIFIATYWTGTARLARAEMLRIRQLPFIEAAVSIGMKPAHIIYREAIPNLLGPVVVAFIFGTGGLLAIESTLSFLGIGLPATYPSWGRTIAGIRSNLSAWWLVAFPGGFLALTVLALQTCSYHLIRLSQQRPK